MNDRTHEQVITRDAYRTFITIMFGAALTLWGSTLLFHGTDSSSSGMTSLGSRMIATTGGQPDGEKGSEEPAGPPSRKPFAYIRQLAARPATAWFAGLSYGLVLICMYWIYMAKISARYPPHRIEWLVLDFLILSALTGAAISWPDTERFCVITLLTLGLLLVRFYGMMRVEKKDPCNQGFANREMLHYLLVYTVCAVFLGGMFAAGISVGQLYNPEALYAVLIVAMGAGAVVTMWHSRKAVEPDEYVTYRKALSVEPDGVPALVPNYGAAKDDALPRIARAVFEGEWDYRRLLKETGNYPPHHYHESAVHTYRDVETQAFIMAHHASDYDEVRLRAMWVYLMHWFDDMFDTQYTARLVRTAIGGELDIPALLGSLNPPLADLWNVAVARNETVLGARWQRGMCEIGMRRLIWSTRMYSPLCAHAHDMARQAHKEWVLGNLEDSSIKTTLAQIDPKYLAYTTKVVVEVWDSFVPHNQWDASMLMNCFYAPGLFHHDSNAEYERSEAAHSAEMPGAKVIETIERVIECISYMDADARSRALKPVPMFVQAFRPILERKGIYRPYARFVDPTTG